MFLNNQQIAFPAYGLFTRECGFALSLCIMLAAKKVLFSEAG